jgi:hypothetical protein
MSAADRQLLAQLKAQGMPAGAAIRIGNRTLTIPKDGPPGDKPGSSPGDKPGEGQTAGNSTTPGGDANQQGGGGGFGPAVERFTVDANRLNDEAITTWTKQLETKVPELVLRALDGIVERLDVLIAQLPGGQVNATAQSRIPEGSRREVEDYFKNLSDDFGDEIQ